MSAFIGSRFEWRCKIKRRQPTNIQTTLSQPYFGWSVSESIKSSCMQVSYTHIIISYAAGIKGQFKRWRHCSRHHYRSVAACWHRTLVLLLSQEPILRTFANLSNTSRSLQEPAGTVYLLRENLLVISYLCTQWIIFVDKYVSTQIHIAQISIDFN